MWREEEENLEKKVKKLEEDSRRGIGRENKNIKNCERKKEEENQR